MHTVGGVDLHAPHIFTVSVNQYRPVASSRANHLQVQLDVHKVLMSSTDCLGPGSDITVPGGQGTQATSGLHSSIKLVRKQQFLKDRTIVVSLQKGAMSAWRPSSSTMFHLSVLRLSLCLVWMSLQTADTCVRTTASRRSVFEGRFIQHEYAAAACLRMHPLLLLLLLPDLPSWFHRCSAVCHHGQW